MTAVAGDGPFSSAPSWLDEGTAVYMQSTRLSYETAVQFGIAADRTLRLRNMESASNNPGRVDIFYGQSWSTVDFLIEQFGEDQFAALFRVIREGARTDTALEQVYGVDQDELYNLWREANNLAAIDFGPRVQGTTAPQAEGTRAPLAIPTGVSSEGDGDADGEDRSDDAAAPHRDRGDGRDASGAGVGRRGRRRLERRGPASSWGSSRCWWRAGSAPAPSTSRAGRASGRESPSRRASSGAAPARPGPAPRVRPAPAPVRRS